MPLGGSLRGVLPNPEVIQDEASLVLAARIFGFRVRDAARELLSSTSSSAVTVADADLQNAVKTFQPPDLRQPILVGGTNVTVTQVGPTTVIAATAGATVSADADVLEAHRAFLRHPDAPARPVADADQLTAARAFLPRSGPLPLPPEDALVLGAIRAFLPHPGGGERPVNDAQLVNAQRASRPVISPDHGAVSVTSATFAALGGGASETVAVELTRADGTKTSSSGTVTYTSPEESITVVGTGTGVTVDVINSIVTLTTTPTPGISLVNHLGSTIVNGHINFVNESTYVTLIYDELDLHTLTLRVNLDAVIAQVSSIFNPHPPRIPQVQAGSNVTITQNALGPVISASVSGSSSFLRTFAVMGA